MKNRTYGYVRVSTREQNPERQLIALTEFGVEAGHIYLDRLSGKDFRRPSWQRLLKRLREGDTLVVKSIDRLGRNYDEIIAQWQLISKRKGIDIVVIDMPLLDTRRGKDILGTFISDIVLQVLSFAAENERENIRQRQAEGIEAAKRRGVRFGRPETALPDEFNEMHLLWSQGLATAKEAAASLGMTLDSFYYHAKKHAGNKK